AVVPIECDELSDLRRPSMLVVATVLSHSSGSAAPPADYVGFGLSAFDFGSVGASIGSCRDDRWGRFGCEARSSRRRSHCTVRCRRSCCLAGSSSAVEKSWRDQLWKWCHGRFAWNWRRVRSRRLFTKLRLRGVWYSFQPEYSLRCRAGGLLRPR